MRHPVHAEWQAVPSMSEQPTPTVLAVDGNSLLHRAFHARPHDVPHARRRAGVGGPRAAQPAASSPSTGSAPTWSWSGSTTAATAAASGAGPPTRRTARPSRRASSGSSTSPSQVLRDLGVVVVVPEGLEADDVLASVSAQAPALGARTVVATSDRDSFALIDEHTRMLRILNGGVDASPLLDPARLAMVTGCPSRAVPRPRGAPRRLIRQPPRCARLRRQDRGQAAPGARHRAGRLRRRRRAAASVLRRRSARPAPAPCRHPRPSRGGCSTAR